MRKISAVLIFIFCAVSGRAWLPSAEDNARAVVLYAEGAACVGTIITDGWILTAGHCVDKFNEFITNCAASRETSCVLVARPPVSDAAKTKVLSMPAPGRDYFLNPLWQDADNGTVFDTGLVRMPGVSARSARFAIADGVAGLPREESGDTYALKMELGQDGRPSFRRVYFSRENFYDASPGIISTKENYGILTKGDSGAPLYRAGQIIGLLSGGTDDSTIFVLFNDGNMDFINRTLK